MLARAIETGSRVTPTRTAATQSKVEPAALKNPNDMQFNHVVLDQTTKA